MKKNKNECSPCERQQISTSIPLMRRTFPVFTISSIYTVSEEEKRTGSLGIEVFIRLYRTSVEKITGKR